MRHVWLVDPLLRTLEALRLESGRWLIVGSWRDDARVRAEPFDAIELELAILSEHDVERIVRRSRLQLRRVRLPVRGLGFPHRSCWSSLSCASNAASVRGAIVAGVGIGALPWFIANQELAAGTITRVLPEYRFVGGSAWVVHAPAKPVPPKVSAFCSHLLEHGARLFTQP